MTIKKFSAPDYNMIFNTEDGLMMRWGKTTHDDPVMCPIGPEIADIEISSICNGIGKSIDNRTPCSWCYKSNTDVGENMSVETFKKILSKFPKTLTQVAFGIGDIDSNPDLWAILDHCRENDVVPNLTTNGMGVEGGVAERLAKTCGAIAVSHYGLNDVCFNAVKELSDRGLKQVNIHKLLSHETYDSCFKLIDAASKSNILQDPRLSGLKAIVFLLLKPKGDRNKLTPLIDSAAYKKLLDYAEKSNVAVGMDSCSAPMAFKSMPKEYVPSIEPCESTLFSIYVNVKGEVFPCSFTEGIDGWETGIDIVNAQSFLKDVWNSTKLQGWREKLLKSSANCSCESAVHCRSCPIYNITVCNPKHDLEQLVQLKRK